MENRIIFQKVYPRLPDFFDLAVEENSSLQVDEIMASSLHGLLKKDCNEKVYVLMPERAEQ